MLSQASFPQGKRPHDQALAAVGCCYCIRSARDCSASHEELTVFCERIDQIEALQVKPPQFEDSQGSGENY